MKPKVKRYAAEGLKDFWRVKIAYSKAFSSLCPNPSAALPHPLAKAPMRSSETMPEPLLAEKELPVPSRPRLAALKPHCLEM